MGIGVVCLLLQVFPSYQRYVRYLKWLTLALLSYVVLVLTIHIPWQEVAARTLTPHFALTTEYLTVIVAVFGTTISPYLFFWQASQEVEELNADPAAGALVHAPEGASEHLRRIKIDTYLGMAFSNIVAFCIILGTAATLNVAGITDIQTSAQAAGALRPLAGEFSFILFALGIIGTGMIAVPVLAGSAAYAVAERNTSRWRSSYALAWWLCTQAGSGVPAQRRSCASTRICNYRMLKSKLTGAAPTIFFSTPATPSCAAARC